MYIACEFLNKRRKEIINYVSTSMLKNKNAANVPLSFPETDEWQSPSTHCLQNMAGAPPQVYTADDSKVRRNYLHCS